MRQCLHKQHVCGGQGMLQGTLQQVPAWQSMAKKAWFALIIGAARCTLFDSVLLSRLLGPGWSADQFTICMMYLFVAA